MKPLQRPPITIPLALPANSNKPEPRTVRLSMTEVDRLLQLASNLGLDRNPETSAWEVAFDQHVRRRGD